jgi:hypothetical protein
MNDCHEKFFKRPGCLTDQQEAERTWGQNIPLKLVSFGKNFFPEKKEANPLAF